MDDFDFGLFHVGRSQRRRVGSVLLLLRFLRLSFNCALVFRNDTFGSHADGEALFQTAFLTFPPHVHVNLATVAVLALVHGVLRYTPPEEAFASFTGEGVVVVAGRSIAADEAELLLLTRHGALLLLGIAETVHRIAVDTSRRRQIFTT